MNEVNEAGLYLENLEPVLNFEWQSHSKNSSGTVSKPDFAKEESEKEKGSLSGKEVT